MKCKCTIDAVDWMDAHCVLISHTEPRARKEHRCGECHGVIKRGEKYERYTGVADGDLFSAKTCLLCVEIRDCFCCTYYFGQVWRHIHDEGLKICALDALSEAAREKFFKMTDM